MAFFEAHPGSFPFPAFHYLQVRLSAFALSRKNAYAAKRNGGKCVCRKKERGKVAICIATFPRSGVRFLADYFTATFTAVLPTRTT